jgi:hypothetical protein
LGRCESAASYKSQKDGHGGQVDVRCITNNFLEQVIGLQTSTSGQGAYNMAASGADCATAACDFGNNAVNRAERLPGCHSAATRKRDMATRHAPHYGFDPKLHRVMPPMMSRVAMWMSPMLMPHSPLVTRCCR